MEGDLATLSQEQEALRTKIRRRLAACASGASQSSPSSGDGLHGPRTDYLNVLPMPNMEQPVQGINPVAAHTTLQRNLLAMLAEHGASIIVPARADFLLGQIVARYPDVAAVAAALSPGNVELALHELQGHAQHAIRVARGVLTAIDADAMASFRAQLMGGSGGSGSSSAAASAAAPAAAESAADAAVGAPAAADATPAAGAAAPAAAVCPPCAPSAAAAATTSSAGGGDGAGGGGGGSGGAPSSSPSSSSSSRKREVDELLDLINRPTASQVARVEPFRTVGGSKLKEYCKSGTKEDCARHNGTGVPCDHIHFRRILLPHTDPSLGDCSYLDTCRHMDKCKFLHYEVDPDDAERMRDGSRGPLDPFGREAANALKEGSDHDPFARHYQSQFVNCDIRTFPMQVLGKFPVIMADPPWDIHMELPYGTMSDDEMRRMNVQVLQDDGVMFLWVTGRAMELGRECLEIWGYRFVQELLWVKTNQLQRIIRTGRTGHWINHSKEHCLVGIKGKPKLNYNLDCDVVCAEVRETSRKPDEMYDLLERLAPGERKLELFGRPHNVHKGWTTLGNQLGKTCITEPWLREHLLSEGVFVEDDLTELPKPPNDPIVKPWGGHAPPEKLSGGTSSR